MIQNKVIQVTTFIYFLFIFILTLPLSSTARSFDFFIQQASQTELQYLLERIESRIYVVENLVDLHQEAINGRKPEYLDSDLLALVNSINTLNRKHTELVDNVALKTPECQRFYKIDKLINLRLISHLQEALVKKNNVSATLEAQIRILFMQNKQLHSLYSMGADGGVSLIMKSHLHCEAIAPIRDQLNLLREERIQHIRSLLSLRFGQEGLKPGFDLSNRLGKTLHIQLKIERTQMITELVALSALTFVGIELGLLRGLNHLVKVGKISHRASRLIKGSTFLLFAGYGAYVTIDLLAPRSDPYTAIISKNDWQIAMDTHENYLIDEPDSPHQLNPIIAEMQLAHHKQVGLSLKNIYATYAQSIRQWGDKETALAEYKRKKTVIYQLINQTSD